MAHLLSRSAECVFWLARYMERVENLSRIIDVTETFARDPASRNWLSVVQINADEKKFFETYPVPDSDAVLEFYLLDANNPSSIQFNIRAAHENARTLRPLVSIEMWAQLNAFHHRLRALTKADIHRNKLSKLCDEIRLSSQEHTGIIEGTFYRDQAWYFYSLGKYLERADQTTRLLDIKYHLLLPQSETVGSALDLSQWNALLRAAAADQAFRRLYSDRITPKAVAAFLLFSDSFPRSVSMCLRQMEWYLAQLYNRYGLRASSSAMERLDEMRGALTELTIDTVLANGLHEFIDWIQRQLGAVAQEIGEAYFGLEPEPAIPLPLQQAQ